jgi:hypothetical protein
MGLLNKAGFQFRQGSLDAVNSVKKILVNKSYIKESDDIPWWGHVDGRVIAWSEKAESPYGLKIIVLTNEDVIYECSTNENPYALGYRDKVIKEYLHNAQPTH